LEKKLTINKFLFEKYYRHKKLKYSGVFMVVQIIIRCEV